MNKKNILQSELNELEKEAKKLSNVLVLSTPAVIVLIDNEAEFGLPLLSILLAHNLKLPTSELVDGERKPTISIRSTFNVNKENDEWIADLKYLANSDYKYYSRVGSPGIAEIEYNVKRVDEYLSIANSYIEKKRELEDYIKENESAIRAQELFASLSSDEKIAVMRELILKGDE